MLVSVVSLFAVLVLEVLAVEDNLVVAFPFDFVAEVDRLVRFNVTFDFFVLEEVLALEVAVVVVVVTVVLLVGRLLLLLLLVVVDPKDDFSITR